MTRSSRLVVVRNPDVVSRTIGGQRLLVPIRGKGVDLGRVFTLNATAAAVWDRLTHPVPVAELAALVAEGYQDSPDTISADVEVLVRDLAERGLATLEEKAE